MADGASCFTCSSSRRSGSPNVSTHGRELEVVPNEKSLGDAGSDLESCRHGTKTECASGKGKPRAAIVHVFHQDADIRQREWGHEIRAGPRFGLTLGPHVIHSRRGNARGSTAAESSSPHPYIGVSSAIHRGGVDQFFVFKSSSTRPPMSCHSIKSTIGSCKHLRRSESLVA